MLITTTLQENMIEVLGLGQLPQSEQIAVFECLGAGVIESALWKFMRSQGEWEQQSFEAWIEEHQHEAGMMELLVTTYPTFGKILTEEILLLKENFKKNNDQPLPSK